MMRLAEYSRDCLRDLRRDTGIRYDERMQGTLQLFRTRKQFDASAADIAVLRECGVAHALLDRAGCIVREPALAAVAEKFVGGLLLPGDETGDCFKFTQRLAALAAARGVVFRHATRIDRLHEGRDGIDGVETSAGTLVADAYLVALGSYSPLLLRPLGLRLPVYPVKGYSLTVPIVDAAGRARIDGHGRDPQGRGDAPGRPHPRRRHGRTRGLYARAARGPAAHARPCRQRPVPKGGDIERAEFWCGLRPMTPDGTPLLGPTPWRNLWLATGHGTLGWTMAAGTARVIADLIGAHQPAIDLDGLTVARYA